ncbi:MAG: calcium/sodium antiporter [Firmicutes bacterium]|nr:calcium/sodium antiporter [Bacillota bacterium]
MIVQILILILGFVLLIKGADIFIDGASSTAQNFKVSKMVIGLTIVAFGTSAPEFAVSMSALISGNNDMVLGNVIGSNILNILLILGIASVICPIKIKDNTVKKEMPLCILMSILLVTLFLDNTLNNETLNQFTRSDAIAVLLFFLVFLYYIFSLAKNKIEEDTKAPYGIFKSIIFILLGLAGIIIGSDLVVDSASKIATTLGVSERIISLTVIAFGTSLPELVTSIVSAKKKEQDILVGNIIGSNIFNICIVLAVPVSIFGTISPSSFSFIDLLMLILTSVMLFIFSKTNKKITKSNGIVMLITFIIYYSLIFFI